MVLIRNANDSVKLAQLVFQESPIRIMAQQLKLIKKHKQIIMTRMTIHRCMISMLTQSITHQSRRTRHSSSQQDQHKLREEKITSVIKTMPIIRLFKRANLSLMMWHLWSQKKIQFLITWIMEPLPAKITSKALLRQSNKLKRSPLEIWEQAHLLTRKLITLPWQTKK